MRCRPGGAAVTATVIAAVLVLSGCGDDSTATGPQPGGAPPAVPSPGQSMDMGDPSATPANKVPDAKVKKGEFTLLATRPPGSDGVKGTAWLAQSSRGTTVTVSMTGLKAGAHYMAHLHAKHCSDGNGGPHFQFVPGGPVAPPNEVHLMLMPDASGKATTTATNDRKTGDGAVAVVVHPYEAQDNRLACADF